MTTSRRGVLTIAHGHPRYAKQAVTLAQSIRLRDPEIAIAVGTNLDPQIFNGMFDAVIPWNFRRRGLLSKLDMYQWSPFQDTLYLDSDVIVCRSLSNVFDRFSGVPLGVIQDEHPRGAWFRNPERVRREFGDVDRVRFNGGLYYFEKCDVAGAVFAAAGAIEDRYEELGIMLQDGQKNEEPMLALAMACVELFAQVEPVDAPLCAAAWPHDKPYYIDAVGGECYHMEGEQKILRVLMHYHGGGVYSYPYLREGMRLEAAFGRRKGVFGTAAWIRCAAFLRWIAATPGGMATVQASLGRRLRSLI